MGTDRLDSIDAVIERLTDHRSDSVSADLGPVEIVGPGTFLTIYREDYPPKCWPPKEGDVVRVTVPRARLVCRPETEELFPVAERSADLPGQGLLFEEPNQ